MGYRLTIPLLRVSMGEDTWFTGDGKLRTVSVELGEDDRSNRCNFSLYDEGNLIGAKYFSISLEKGGIEVPPDLLQSPQENAPGIAGGSSGGAVNTTLTPHARAFLDAIASVEAGPQGYLSVVGGGGFTDFARHPEIRSRALNSDAAGRYQFLSSTWNKEVAPAIGATDFSPANQDIGAIWYANARGGSEVATAIEAGNVVRLRAILGCPGEAGCVWQGMTKNPAKFDAAFRAALAGYLATPSAAQPMPATEAQAGASAPVANEDVALTKPQEVSKKGTEIVIELGYEIAQMTGFHFIHTQTSATALSDRSVSFGGQGIRYLLSRRSQNTSYENITLKELGQIICTKYRLTLDMPGDGPTFIFLDQTGISDYELLYRECKGIGWKVGEDGRSLVLRPVIPNFTGFLIDETLAASFTFGDQASNERIMPPPGGLSAQSVPSSVAEQRKATVDPKTGKVAATAPEDTTGTGSGSGMSSTGAPNAAVLGTTTNRNDPAAAAAAIRQARSAEGGAGQNQPSPVASVGRQINQSEGSSLLSANNLDSSIGAMGEVIARGRAKEEAAKSGAAGGDKDGAANVASTQAASYEIARGYESSCTFKTIPAALKLKPGDIIAISNTVLPAPFAREWRVSRITHTAQGGSLSTSLSIYSPVAVQKKESSATPGAGGVVSNAPTGKLQNPMPAAIRGTPFDPSGRIRGRPHKGIDLSGGSSDDILCAASGKVARVVTGCRVGDTGCGGRFGNVIYVDHDGEWTGYSTVYAHLSQVLVGSGATVSKGQKIGVEGNTGSSGGNHLHFELRRGNSPQDPEPYLVPCPSGTYGQGARFPLRCSNKSVVPQPT